jgi:hypothetical protein
MNRLLVIICGIAVVAASALPPAKTLTTANR